MSRSVYDFTHDSKGRCLIDHFIRFEHLDSEFQSLARHLGFADSVVEISRLNVTLNRRKSYQSYHTDETIELIEKRYAFEVEKFNYVL